MQQSVIYQEILHEGEQVGEQRGVLKGEQSLILRLLTRRIGDITPEIRSQIQTLPLTQLEDLGEALLDFKDGTDLQDWLRSHG
jgi:predicted transposase YdaD